MFFCKDPDTDKTQYKFFYRLLFGAMLPEGAAPGAMAPRWALRAIAR